MTEKTLDILPSFSGYKEGTLCFKTGAGSLEDGGTLGPSAISQFYERVILGDSFPPKMIINHTSTMDFALAFLLFSRPELVLETRTAGLVRAVDLYTRLGVVGLSVLPAYDRRLLEKAQGMMQQQGSSVEAQFQGIRKAAAIFEEEIRLSSVLPDEPPFEVLDEHDGFVRYKANMPCLPEVYAAGYMGGQWEAGSLSMVFKRSPLVTDLPLDRLRSTLDNDTLKDVWLAVDDATLMSKRGLTETEHERTWVTLKSFLGEAG